jgi:hypothetical protein
MSAPLTTVALSEAERWREWQNRGVEGDRRRGVAMRWVMGVIVIGLGALFAGFL